MAVRVRIARSAKTSQVVLDERLSFKTRQERAAAFARQEIAEADEINKRALGSVPPKTITVDGRNGAPLNSVNPDRGIIIAEWTMAGQVVEWIAQTLRDRSPVISGRYKNHHILFADGSEVSSADDPPAAHEYIFLNPVPYSRKIEIGKTKAGRDFVIQVPNRIYERTATDAQRRFGNIAKIRFTYQSAVGGKNSADRVPAIVVTTR